MPAEVVNNIRRIEEIGPTRYQEILCDRFKPTEGPQEHDTADPTNPITAPLSCMKLKLWRDGLTAKSSLTPPLSQTAQTKTIHQQTVDILTSHQAGRAVSAVTLSHESSTCPPAFTNKGLMHHGTKSYILGCILPSSDSQEISEPVGVTVSVLDGAVIVQMLRPNANTTSFQDYIQTILVPYILGHLHKYDRVDLIFDVYIKDSLKAGLRRQRGTGRRLKVSLKTKLPGDWSSFLRVDQNKEELFILIVRTLMTNLDIPEVRGLNRCVAFHI